MEFKISVDDSAGALIAGLSKLLVDVDNAAIKSGHPVGSAEYIALFSAAANDLVPVLMASAAGVTSAKAKPIDFGVAFAAQLVSAFGL